jgi:phosphatidylinositol alpha-1,6-mannosyltransferase
VVTNDFPPRRGGIENYVKAWCDAMPPDAVIVYTARMAGSDVVDATTAYPVVRDRSRILLPTRRVARRVEALARQRGCERVVFGASAPLGLLASGLRRRAGIEHVTAMTHGHEVWWARLPVTRFALRRIADQSDVITYVSTYCRDQITPALSARARGRMTELRPTIDHTRFRPGLDGSGWRQRLGLAADAPVVLAASRLVRRKGQDLLIQGWPDVLQATPGARLVIVGDGPARRRLGRLARASGVGETITFVPGVSWEEMPPVYAMADVFALPARTRLWGLQPEAFGIVYLEAAACGLRVVGGASGGAAEVVRSVGGVAVDPRSSAAVASAVTEALRGAV